MVHDVISEIVLMMKPQITNKDLSIFYVRAKKSKDKEIKFDKGRF